MDSCLLVYRMKLSTNSANTNQIEQRQVRFDQVHYTKSLLWSATIYGVISLSDEVMEISSLCVNPIDTELDRHHFNKEGVGRSGQSI